MIDRFMTKSEIFLVNTLLEAFSLGDSNLVVNELTRVSDMDDGGMGSLLFSSKDAERHYGGRCAEAWFFDSDSAVVWVTLNLDESGALYEVDSDKMTYDRLIEIPLDPQRIHPGAPTAEELEKYSYEIQ